jgi:flavin reductase (DIM6/NTAB) family NADH-FMN oxidoreductase RutF
MKKEPSMRKNLGIKTYLYPQPTLVIATYNEDGTPNAMVAAWGSVSDTNQVAIYVAHSHKTMQNILERKAFTVSMANEKNIKAIDYLGVTSGNKVADKFKKSGLTAIKSENVDAPLIAELPLALECKLVSYDEKTELLLGEIVNATADDSVLDENGKLSVEKLAPVCYDSAGHGYYVMERRVGNAFSDGKTL